MSWCNYCYAHCLLSAVPEKTPITPDPPEEIDLTNVSREYHELQDVFSKDHALSLPPHGLAPWNGGTG